MNLLASIRMQVQSLAPLGGLRIQRCTSCGVGSRCGLDPELLWLWYRPVATAPIRFIAWEPPYAVGVTLKRIPPNKKVFESLFSFFLSGWSDDLQAPYMWNWKLEVLILISFSALTSLIYIHTPLSHKGLNSAGHIYLDFFQ